MEKMGEIIKIQIKLPEITKALVKFRKNRLKALDEITTEVRTSVAGAIEQLLDAEMTLFLGSPEQDNNKKNGYKERDYALKGIGGIRFRFPRDRKSQFNSSIIPRHEQVDPRLKEDLAILHLAGLSTRTIAMITKRFLGIELSAGTVTNSLDLVSEKAIAWLERPLSEKYWALFVDGTNFKIQRRGSSKKSRTMVAIRFSRHTHQLSF